jgi:hypothetical protein
MIAGSLAKRTEAHMHRDLKNRVPSVAEILVGEAGAAWRRWRDRGEFAAFAAANPDEAQRIAQELGTDTESLVRLSGGGQEWQELLNRRLRLAGLDPDTLAHELPATARDLARCCALCDSKGECARDLDRAPASSGWKAYCPNEQTITALASEHDPSKAQPR